MNLNEAYSILELSPGVSPEDAKKKYRELTKKYHPDVNKEEGAEDKFKRINEAYQVVSTGKSTDKEDFIPQQHNPFGGFNPFGNPFGGTHRVIRAENIDLFTQISFVESVLGCKKEITYQRKNKCQECDGQGDKKINNGCDKCGGQGQIVGKQGNMIFTRTCDKCWGRTQTIACTACINTGVIDTTSSVSVTIPGGVVNGNILRLGGMGNYIGNIMGSDTNTDVMLHITVTPNDTLSIQGMDVISSINISLLEAIIGTKSVVATIDGEKEIIIPRLTKNKDEVIIPNLGVSRIGSQKVILHVEYPEDTEELVKVLLGDPRS
jgi:molecular chaperone DnaJ